MPAQGYELKGLGRVSLPAGQGGWEVRIETQDSPISLGLLEPSGGPKVDSGQKLQKIILLYGPNKMLETNPVT